VPAFNKTLGVKLTSISPGNLTLELPYKPDFLGNPLVSALHGGVCAALLDHAGACMHVCAFARCFIMGISLTHMHRGTDEQNLETAAGFCAWSVLPDDTYGTSTIDLRIDYVRPAPCEDLVAEATIKHKGSRLIWADATVRTKAKDETVAFARGTFNVYKLPMPKPMSEMLQDFVAASPSDKSGSK